MRNREPWSVHDLRRTLATGFQRLGIRFEVTEAVLNHVSGAKGRVAGIHQRHDWKQEKRAALSAWSAHIERLNHTRDVDGKVVGLRPVSYSARTNSSRAAAWDRALADACQSAGIRLRWGHHPWRLECWTKRTFQPGDLPVNPM